ncbi:DUF1540 domain-containing protein [Clostridium sp. 19966]|uniref:DUF1540 domain-containing protein n=1 Tax=Clostridium sp. 19966 TaxID=2768166 RepID=UPI0028DE609E|nr:DUF1540 domain-containing protein [Clostridium sp. 19966]MDT8716181.1 DUF1540 domain-containing protein [Clostridium sp. 19966]
MQGKVEKKDSPLQGVKCVVSSCYYHNGNNHCSASGIEIAPRDAHTPHETDCSTFTPLR